MSILDSFNLGNVFSALADETITASTSTTTTLTAGKRVPYTGSINGTSVPCYVTLHEAYLTRLSLLQQTQMSTGRDYYLVTGILKPVKMDIELMIDGSPMNLIDFLTHVTNQSSNSNMSRDEFIMAARRIGINFADGMPLFFQQFGASKAGFEQARDIFTDNGASDVRGQMTNPGRILAAYSHSVGVPVTSFELGSVDRTKSPRQIQFPEVPQGFINLVDAQIEQFSRILRFRKEAHVLTEQIDPKMPQEKIKKLQSQAKTLTDMSKQWVASWSGAQRRIEQNANGTFSLKDMYDPANAPCGRFTLAGTEIDLWTNSKVADTSTNVTAPKANPF
jgi:hypothetical protein